MIQIGIQTNDPLEFDQWVRRLSLMAPELYAKTVTTPPPPAPPEQDVDDAPVVKAEPVKRTKKAKEEPAAELAQEQGTPPIDVVAVPPSEQAIATPAPSKQDVDAAVKALYEKKGLTAVKDVLGRFKAAKASEVKEHERAAFIGALTEALA